MTAFSMIRPTRAAGFVAVLALFAAPAHAQIGSLIKKKLEKPKETTEQAGGQAVVFDAVTLEITQERIEKMTTAKRAVRTFAQSPQGPAALEKQIEALDARQAAIYEKQVTNINAWDEKRQAYENCVDSVLSEIASRKNAQFQSQMAVDPAAMRKLMELGQAMLAAQQKRDTAGMRKIAAEIEQMKAPTKADSAEAMKHCAYPVQPPLVKEWMSLKRQIDSLGNLKQDAESKQGKMEEQLSGMNPRQSAIFCERIKLYIQQLKEKKKHVGFSDEEVKRLANLEQAIKDLEELCP